MILFTYDLRLLKTEKQNHKKRSNIFTLSKIILN